MLLVKELKEQARQILNKQLLVHAAALLMPAVCALSLYYTGIMLVILADSLLGITASAIALYLLFLVIVAFAIPLIYGYFQFLTGCLQRGRADFADVFAAFSDSETYIRSFRVFISVLWRFLAIFSLPITLIICFLLYTDGVLLLPRFYILGYNFNYTVFAVAIIATLVISTAILPRISLALYICVTRQELSVYDCFFASRLYMKKTHRTMTRLNLSFIPLLLLGFLIPFIGLVYALPYVFIAAFVFAHNRYNDISLNELTTKMYFS